MPATNADIARILHEVAELLQMEGANQFRVRAYRNAARRVELWPEPLHQMVSDAKDLTVIPSIGPDLAQKVAEVVQTGRLRMLEEKRASLPPATVALLRVPGLGPKRARRLQEELGVSSIDALRTAAKEGRIRALKGFGQTLERNLLAVMDEKPAPDFFLRAHVAATAEAVLDLVRGLPGVVGAELAGSFRRGKETVADLDIVAASDDPQATTAAFASHRGVQRVSSAGPTRATVRLSNGLQVDLRAVPPEAFGATLVYFTGSKEHNIGIRKRALKLGLKLNEYGLMEGERRLASVDEAGVYEALGMAWIPPELREDRGEVEAALRGELPSLLELEHIRGDLHTHTDATDGRDTLERMVAAAQKLGYAYMAVTDHTKRTSIARGLDAGQTLAHIRRIDRLNEQLDGFTILKGAEVDILKDGRLDLPDDVLEQLDVTVCSLHHRERQDGKAHTQRILAAMSHPRAFILGHCSGRLLGKRPPMDLDFEAILEAARDGGWAIEVDGQPDRLDLDDEWCLRAKRLGVMLTVDSDAHSTRELGFMQNAVVQARRGWLEPKDVLNTRSLKDLRRWLDRR